MNRVIILRMIRSFACQDTEALSRGERVRRWVNIERAALRKLEQLHVSARLDDLRVPPGNRLELLKGDRAGQYSIRINDQWRVCFAWRDDAAHEVEIVDYH
jgi:proteic killer suppression protein